MSLGSVSESFNLVNRFTLSVSHLQDTQKQMILETPMINDRVIILYCHQHFPYAVCIPFCMQMY